MRFTRIGKLYRLIRMMRLFRLFKMIKERDSIAQYMAEILKISIGFERFLFMLVTYLVLQHIMACLW